MTKYRNDLPQVSDALLLTDGGMVTVLIFQEGIDLRDTVNDIEINGPITSVV